LVKVKSDAALNRLCRPQEPGLKRLAAALTPSKRLTFDYQFLANPAYNADRGPVNIFAGRAHWRLST